MMVAVRSAAIGVLVGVLNFPSACGSEPDRLDATAESTPAPAGTIGLPPGTENDATRTSSPSGTETVVVVDPAALPPMDVVAALGYPRDLLDRGRVNVKVSRDDDTDFVILDKQLVADHFTPAAVEERRTLLPPNGRTVALQTLFGEVADCDSIEPVTASLVVTFTYGNDSTLKSAAIPFTDAATLDYIRVRQCTVQRVLAENEIELRDEVVDGETLSVDLVIRRRTGESRLSFDSIKGTVLFGVTTQFVPGAPARILEPDETEAVIPIVVDVNRCDSHAVAETTRRFGIDLYVSVDGSESQLVQVPIDDLVADLEAMLESCMGRTGQ